MNIQHAIDSAQIRLNSRRMVKVKKHSSKIGMGLVKAVFLLGFSFIIMYPIISMISKAFMQQGDIFDNTVIWIPKHFTLDNLKMAASTMNYGKSFANSVFISGMCTILQTVMCMTVGYGFARYEFPLKNILFVLVLLTFLIPPQAMMIPLFLEFRKFDILGLVTLISGQPQSLLNTNWPYILLAATCQGLRNGLFIFMFRQSFRAMPREIEEAAWVDGAGAFRTYIGIMVPNATTMIATVALFGFVWQWNDSFYSGLFSPNDDILASAYSNFTTSLGLLSTETEGLFSSLAYDLSNQRIVSLLKNSAVFLIMTPLIMVYLVAQHWFVESVERSGLVG